MVKTRLPWGAGWNDGGGLCGYGNISDAVATNGAGAAWATTAISAATPDSQYPETNLKLMVISTQQLFSKPWSMLTAASLILLILATVLSLDGQPAVQAHDNQGAIGNLSVSSPDPGQLVAAWSAPSETPTDYRVRWAPTGQDYLSYSEDNTSERGSAYPEALNLTVDRQPA